MNDFKADAEAHRAKLNRSIAELVDRLEKDAAELVTYINNAVVPNVRAHSSTALRVVSEKLSQAADHLEGKNRH